MPRLPFSKKNKKGNRTRALASVEVLRQWAKAQAVMLYGGSPQPRVHSIGLRAENPDPLTILCHDAKAG